MKQKKKISINKVQHEKSIMFFSEILASFLKKSIFTILFSPKFGDMPMFCKLNGKLHNFSISCSKSVSLKSDFIRM